VALDLLGKVLVHGERQLRLSEVEAYLPEGDRAAHCAAGLTPRTRVIFGPPGHAYVYLNYGIHHLINIVVEPAGTPGCVLLRAGHTLDGLPVMGPGRLTRYLGLDLSHYGADLCHPDASLHLLDAPAVPQTAIQRGPRIGIRKSAELHLRFFIA
jgi:DNA-3-methyladenine glycosylase